MSGPLPLYTADEMRAVDARAIGELGIPGAVLMERAGLAAADEILRLGGSGSAAVVCGAGNNGGDGFVVARHLHAAGWDVECLLAGDVGKLPPDARLNHDIAKRLGIAVVDGVRRARLKRADVVVDALLGTGFRGAPRGAVAQAIEAMRPPIGTIVALDVPSGVDGSTGAVVGAAVRADVTVCFHGRKLGTAVEPGRSAACRVVVADIGIPREADQGDCGDAPHRCRDARGRLAEGDQGLEVHGRCGARDRRRARVCRRPAHDGARRASRLGGSGVDRGTV